jgi:hypothetical protein
MGCNCGGGRRGPAATAAANTIANGGSAGVYRLTHRNGATVDYWTQKQADDAQQAAPGSAWAYVDYRTGTPIGAPA